MEFLLVAIGAVSIFIGFFGALAIFRGPVMRDDDEEAPPPPKGWLFGVCADVAQMLRVPVTIVRLIVLIYAPFLLGILFYVVYWWFLRQRRKRQALAAQRPQRAPATVTKIDSIHYRR
jgi:phage shock protein PspC (stress-responsive transcriptional regulator)